MIKQKTKKYSNQNIGKEKSLILYLAPLNKLGNQALRTLCLNHGADFVFSEMIKIDQLLQDDDVQLRKVTILPQEQEKTIIQILAEDISLIEKGVEKIKQINPNIKEINYNMGCPQSTLCRAYSGGGIIKNPQKIKEVCKLLSNACKKHNLTPSIKTRIGITRDNLNIFENIKIIEQAKITKIYLHGRVLSEPYSKPATYEEIGKLIEQNPQLQIIANGDITDSKSLEKLEKQTFCNQILIGRTALENPCIFEELKNNNSNKSMQGFELKNKQDIILEFLQLAGEYNLSLSHIKSNIAYLTKGALKGADLRRDINNIKEVKEIINYFKKL